MKKRLSWLIIVLAVIGFLCVPLMIRASEHTSSNVTDHVDLIEVNHLYDERGRLVIEQVIFYDWDHATDRFQVVAWRLLKSPEQFPQRHWESGRFVARWRDQAVWREVSAGQVCETWTTFDPEVLERNMFPIEKRRELSDPGILLAGRPHPAVP